MTTLILKGKLNNSTPYNSRSPAHFRAFSQVIVLNKHQPTIVSRLVPSHAVETAVETEVYIKKISVQHEMRATALELQPLEARQLCDGGRVLTCTWTCSHS